MSIQRGTFDIALYYADDDVKRLTFTTEDADGNEVPYDLTVFDEIRMQAKFFQSYEAEALVTWTLGDGLSIEGDGNEVLEVDLTFEKTKPLTGDQEYVFDIRFLQGGELDTLLEGTIKSNESVTTR